MYTSIQLNTPPKIFKMFDFNYMGRLSSSPAEGTAHTAYGVISKFEHSK